MARSLNPAVLALILCATTAVAVRAADIKSSEGSIPRKAGTAARAQIFEFDPAAADIEIFATRSIKGDHEDADVGLSVRKAADYPYVARRTMSRSLLVNGGSSGAKSDRPVGLLISNGKVASVPSYAIRNADPHSSCSFRNVDRYRLSGLLCVGADHSVKIGKIDQVPLEKCQQAVQAGPMLVEAPSKVAVCGDDGDDKPYTRTAVCVSGNRMKVVLALDPVLLFDLANWMADKKNGLACDSALNLSGDTSSGAVFYPGGIRSVIRVGEGKFPQASLILIHSGGN